MPDSDDIQVRIVFSPEHLVALRDWLTAEDPLRGRVSPPSIPKPGEMGGAVEVLTVPFGFGAARPLPARSPSMWQTQRKADITGTDGRQVAVDVERAGDPESVTREFGALLGQGQ